MPKRHQNRLSKQQVGRNNPRESTVNVKPSFDPTAGMSHEADSRAMMEEGEKRSGSDSDASKHRKGSRLHEKAQRQPPPHPGPGEDFVAEDLNPDDFAGEDHGLLGKPVEYGVTAYDVKELYPTLADLTDDELKNIPILPLGSDLQQGAKYIDLRHLEQGEFTARAGMVADEGHYYVPKKEVGYVLWNRLNQVTNPARLDEQG